MKKLTIIFMLLVCRWASAQSACDMSQECPAAAGGAVTWDASTASGCTGATCTSGGTVLTYALTVASNSNRQLVVITHTFNGGTPPAVSTVTYNAVGLVQQAVENGGLGGEKSTVWNMTAGVQPDTGTHNVVITLAGALSGASQTLLSGAWSIYNANQTTPWRTQTTCTGGSANNINGGICFAGGSGATSTATGNVSGANDLIIWSSCGGSSFSSTTLTQRWIDNLTGANGCGNGIGDTAVGNTLTGSATMSGSDSWVAIYGSVQP
jgi:hypothetical protein